MRLVAALLAALLAWSPACGQIVQFSGAPVTSDPAYTFPLDTWTGATVGYSLRKLRSAYAGNAVELQRTSDNTTQTVGFTAAGNPASASSFCTFTTLAVTTSSARVAFPSGSRLGLKNVGANPAYYNPGNSSVTATTSSTWIQPNGVVAITVGANTHIAGITLSGTSQFQISDCGVRTWYDQTATGANAVQTTQSKQPFYFQNANGALSKPVIGHPLDTYLAAADNAAYKTATVHAFMASRLSIPLNGFSYVPNMPVGYPNTVSSSDVYDLRWGMVNGGGADILIGVKNANANGNTEGLGAVYRSQLYVYDWLSNPNTIYLYSGLLFYTDAGGTTSLTYPTATGLYLGGSSNGTGGPLDNAEIFVYSSSQASNRAAITANVTGYWGITAPPTQTSTADGFLYTPNYIGTFNQNGSYYSINGHNYASEAAWASYSLWSATNVKTSGTTSLGDMVRFDVREADNWFGQQERSEYDGFAFAYAHDITVQISYAFWVESGTAYSSSWNIIGQYHAPQEVGLACCIMHFGWEGETLKVYQDSSTLVYTSATLSRDTWYDIFVEVKVSTDNLSDVLKVWVNGSQVVNNSGNLFTNSGIAGTYWKYGNYRGDSPIIPTFAIRYANMEVTNKAVSDITARIATPLDHPVPIP